VNAGQEVETGVRGDCDADIDADEAWVTTTGHPLTKIALLGYPIDHGHEELAGIVSGDRHVWEELVGYSTAEAGIIAARTDNGVGIAGMNWKAKLVCKIVDAVDDPNDPNDTIRLANKIVEAAIIDEAAVLNHNWRPLTPSGAPLQTIAPHIKVAFRIANSRGSMNVVPVGDDGVLGANPPARERAALGVGATDENDVIDPDSNRGWVDIVAPGRIIRTTFPRGAGDYIKASGTAIAAPHVTGLASLLLAYDPLLDADDVEHIMKVSALDLGPVDDDSEYGAGRISAEAALSRLNSPYRLVHDDVAQTVEGAPGNIVYYHGDVAPLVLIGQDDGVLKENKYYAEKWTMVLGATFPAAFDSPPDVWIRRGSTTGIPDDNPNFDYGWAEISNISATGCTFQTYFYRLYTCWPPDCNNKGTFVGNFHELVRVSYSALGTLSPVDANDTSSSRESTRIHLKVQNPFHDSGLVSFFLPERQMVGLQVFDVTGRLVAQPFNGMAESGVNEVPWNGRATTGSSLPSGIYLIRLEAETASSATKFVLVR
jgi:subtilisin family serine protease